MTNAYKKLCNCGVNYTKNYYIIYIILYNNSIGYILHCGGNGWRGQWKMRDVVDDRLLARISMITGIVISAKILALKSVWYKNITGFELNDIVIFGLQFLNVYSISQNT